MAEDGRSAEYLYVIQRLREHRRAHQIARRGLKKARRESDPVTWAYYEQAFNATKRKLSLARRAYERTTQRMIKGLHHG